MADNQTVPETSYTVLYIEDNASNRDLVRFIFSQRENIALIEAENGTQGLEKAEREKPDIILLDLSLPDFTGYEVLKKLKQTPSMSSIPVIALTGDNAPGDRDKCLNAGFHEHLAKPIRVQQFFETIDQTIASL